MIRVIIVDDEWLSRKRLETLLAGFLDCRIIGNCGNGKEAVEEIRDKLPDLVFLDVEMPDMNGFEVLKGLPNGYQPDVIFTTAYDQYAVDAFGVQALDYLLKPFDEDRLSEAWQRVKKRSGQKKQSALQRDLLQLVKKFQREDTTYLYELEIKEKGKIISVPIELIYYFNSEGNYVALHTLDRKYLYRMTMNALMESLPPDEFLRIHRTYIINTRYLNSYRYLNNNEYEFSLKSGKTLRSGKGYKDQIVEFLSKNY